MKFWIVVVAVLLVLLHPAAFGQSAGQAADDAKQKAQEALDAFTRAVEQMSAEAGKRAQEAVDAMRGTVQDTVRRACDSALQACLKVCDGTKCEQACRSGRDKCRADN